MEDLVMANVAADIDEVRDVILALMPRLHTALVKRECEGCTIYHPSQTQHQCLDPVDEETTKIGNIGSVSAEEMILNFMLNMDLFSYK